MNRSTVDSDRFGVSIGRVALDEANRLGSILDDARASGIAMLIIRVAAEDLGAAQAIERAGGWLCDTLVYWEHGLETVPPAPDQVRIATLSDANIVEMIATAAFVGYRGHYQADPRLDRRASDAGYAHWARRSVEETGVADRVLLAEDDGRAVGFLTLGLARPAETEILLNAVDPAFRRRGHYGRLLAAALAWSAEIEARRCIVSTSLSNVPVQRAWESAGFVPGWSFQTFHLWLDRAILT